MLVAGPNPLIRRHFRETTGCEQLDTHSTTLRPKIRWRQLVQFYRSDHLVNTGSLLLAETHSAHQ